MTYVKVDEQDAGCWIDGSYGIYGNTVLLTIANDFGYVLSTEVEQAKAKSNYHMTFPSAPALTDEENLLIDEEAQKAEEWMNEHVAAEGYNFEWIDGEFFLSKTREN